MLKRCGKIQMDPLPRLLTIFLLTMAQRLGEWKSKTLDKVLGVFAALLATCLFYLAGLWIFKVNLGVWLNEQGIWFWVSVFMLSVMALLLWLWRGGPQQSKAGSSPPPPPNQSTTHGHQSPIVHGHVYGPLSITHNEGEGQKAPAGGSVSPQRGPEPLLEFQRSTHLPESLGVVNIGDEDARRVNVRCLELPTLLEFDRIAPRDWHPCREADTKSPVTRINLRTTLFSNEKIIEAALNEPDQQRRVVLQMVWKNRRYEDETSCWELFYNAASHLVDVVPKSMVNTHPAIETLRTPIAEPVHRGRRLSKDQIEKLIANLSAHKGNHISVVLVDSNDDFFAAQLCDVFRQSEWVTDGEVNRMSVIGDMSEAINLMVVDRQKPYFAAHFVQSAFREAGLELFIGQLGKNSRNLPSTMELWIS